MKKYLDLYVVNGMYWVTAAAFLPFIGAYYTSIGMSEGQVGVLAAVFPLAALGHSAYLGLPERPYGKEKADASDSVRGKRCVGASVSMGGYILEMFFLLSCCMRSFLQRCFPSAMRWLSRRPKEGG